MEDFKQIPGYERYGISRAGQVKNLKTDRILKPFISNNYLTISLFNEGKRKPTSVHVAMAITYLNHIPMGSTLVVDHINKIKTDNRLENLQIITQRENISRSIEKSLPLGVRKYITKSGTKYSSSIRIGNKRLVLGYFNTPEEAHQAYLAAIPQ